MYIDLSKFSRKQILKLLGVLVLSDGWLYMTKNRGYIRLLTSEKSTEQHNLFYQLCKKLSNKEPKRYVIFRESGFGKPSKFIQSNLTDMSLITELLNLSPTFKTTKGKESYQDFLKSNQPSIKFIFNESDDFKKACLSVWFDFDGSISPTIKLKHKKDRKGGRIYNYYQVQLEIDIQIAETNPTLVKELLDLCRSMNLKCRIKHNKRNWSGIDGIVISEIESVKKFIDIGPATNVPISMKSNRFCGIEKKTICEVVNSILKENIVLSKSFKDMEEALKYRQRLRSLLYNKITQVAPSYSGQRDSRLCMVGSGPIDPG